MQKNTFTGAALLLLLTACSSLEERQLASGGFDYLTSANSNQLLTPDDKDPPDFAEDYSLPALGERAPTELIGQKLRIDSPQLVLPLVAGSHITEGAREALVWFDKVDDSKALDTTIWNSLLSYLEEQEIGVASFDNTAQTLVSDWILIDSEEDSSWYSWNKTARKVGKRFEFALSMKPHGRSAALKVVLRDYLETVDDRVIADLDEASARHQEIAILNSVISHYAQQIRIADVRRLRKIQQGLAMELTANAAGEPAFAVAAEYDIAWNRLLLVLRKLGFNVKDLDKSNGLLFVNYTGSDSGWWDGILGESNELPLDKTEYRLLIEQVDRQTFITFQDSDSKVLDGEVVAQMYEPMAAVMSTDDLDI